VTAKQKRDVSTKSTASE